MRDVLRRLFLDPEPPLVALEVRPRALGIVRLARRGSELAVAAAASLALPDGALEIGMTEPNIRDAAAFQRTLRSLLERAGVAAGARAALILPDPVVRVCVLPAEEVKARSAVEGEEIIRFRLKKALPFDVRDARVAHRRDAAGQVLAAVGLRAVLDPYEAECRAAGLEPGLVEACGLTLLEAVEASRPSGDRLILNWDDGYVSIFLVRAGAVALARTLSGAAVGDPASVLREVENTVVYYRERLAGLGLSAALVRSAALPPADAIRLLRDAVDAPVQAIEAQLGSAASGLGQDVAGASASLLGRVA